MKIFSLLIFSSLIAFIFNFYEGLCSPDYLNGTVSLSICTNARKVYSVNECCMISYTDEEGTSHNVCIEFDAKMLTHYEQLENDIKKFIHSYYSLYPDISSLDNLYCSSEYIKFSLLALLLVLL